MPITDDNRIIYEYKCRECGTEVESDGEKLPLGSECPDCGEYLSHVGPIVDECDKCNQPLLYTGNRVNAFGLDTICDGCYDRIDAGI